MANVEQVKREIRNELTSHGYSIAMLNEWPARATYYRKDGEPLPNLPADPFSMKKYLGRGLTLRPPDNPVEPEKASVGVPFLCSVSGCSFSAQTRSGLTSHTKKHTHTRT